MKPETDRVYTNWVDENNHDQMEYVLRYLRKKTMVYPDKYGQISVWSFESAIAQLPSSYGLYPDRLALLASGAWRREKNRLKRAPAKNVYLNPKTLESLKLLAQLLGKPRDVILENLVESAQGGKPFKMSAQAKIKKLTDKTDTAERETLTALQAELQTLAAQHGILLMECNDLISKLKLMEDEHHLARSLLAQSAWDLNDTRTRLRQFIQYSTDSKGLLVSLARLLSGEDQYPLSPERSAWLSQECDRLEQQLLVLIRPPTVLNFADLR